MEKSEIVNHFKREGYPRHTIYDTINRMQLGRTISDKKKTYDGSNMQENDNYFTNKKSKCPEVFALLEKRNIRTK